MDIDIKQVIVIRADLRNSKGEKIRTGKIIAQACHASLSFLTKHLQNGGNFDNLTEEEKYWVGSIFKKICLKVDSESELIEIHQKSLNAGLKSYLIIDSGLTEFAGEPTKTCCAIGPHRSDSIDKITGHLKLL